MRTSTRSRTDEFHQGRLFNPDVPPQAFSREETDTELNKIRADMQEAHARRVDEHNARRSHPSWRR